jgi:glucosylceramidase
MWMTEVCHAYEIGEPKSMPMPRYDFEDGDLWGNMILSDLEAGASAWIYWNMIVDEKGGPWLVSVAHGDPDPNAQHPVVVINRQTHGVSYTGLYYYLAHFSKFVRPGDRRVETRGQAEKVRCMAFKAPSGGMVVQLVNSGKEPARLRLSWHDRALPVSLPAVSITTLRW